MTYYRRFQRSRFTSTLSYNQPVLQTITESELTDPNLLSRIQNIRCENGLSDWEKNFLESIDQFFGTKNRLSWGQYNTLKNIESRFTPVIKAAREEFKNQFNDDMRSDMKIVAHTYLNMNSLYHRNIISSILTNEQFMPTKEEWDKFMNNKYAKGYLDNFKSSPKFKIGDTVCPSSIDKTERYKIAVVLDNEGLYPLSYATGGKRYMILPYGHTNTIMVEERELKFKRE